MTIADKLAEALHHHQAGDLHKAETLYRQVLQADPRHADAHHLLGVLACQSGQPQKAVLAIRQALGLNPEAASYHANLGVAYEALGQWEQAAGCYFQALRLRPSDADAHYNLANILRRQQKLDDAVVHYDEALRLRPDYAQAHCNLGLALADQGKLADAVGHFLHALRLNPHAAEVHNNLGTTLTEMARLDDAVASFQQALRIKSDFAQAHFGLGCALQRQGHFDEAARCYQQAIRLDPQYAEAYHNLGHVLASQNKLDDAIVCYQQALQLKADSSDAHIDLATVRMKQDQFDEAIRCFRQAVVIKPDSAPAHFGLGCAFDRLGKLDSAIVYYRQAVQLDPDYAEAHNNLGSGLERQNMSEEALPWIDEALRINPDLAEAHLCRGITLQSLGRLEVAESHFHQALHLRPEYAEAHNNLAYLWLLLGDFERGWPKSEWRWLQPKAKQRELAQPLWDGSDLSGRTILLYAEQGLGDTVQFIRYVPLVKMRGARIVVECQPALLKLLAGVPGIDLLVPKDSPLLPVDVQAPLLSLPGIVQTTLDTIPTVVPYVHADAKLVDYWQRELEALPGFKVGIAWQGNPAFRFDSRRSVALAHFAPLAKVHGVQLISLQKRHGTDQLQAPAGRLPVLDWADRLDEASEPFMDTAAAMKSLDLVICTDSAVAHLAGALAVPVWVILGKAPDWRWLLQREDCPWYPTMRLFRQTRHRQWEDVFVRMADELRSLCSSPSERNFRARNH